VADGDALAVFPLVMKICLMDADENERIDEPFAVVPPKFTEPKSASFRRVHFESEQTDGSSAIHSADESVAVGDVATWVELQVFVGPESTNVMV
jgi:hypothetical protein